MPRGKHGRKGDFTRGKWHRPAGLIAALNREEAATKDDKSAETLTTAAPSLPAVKKAQTTTQTLEIKTAEAEPGKENDDPEGVASEEDDADPNFRRRKVTGNAWRYEEEELELEQVISNPTEPEDDYASIVIAKQKAKFSAEKDLDPDSPERAGKGKIQIVDRKEFQDIAEKTAKQSAADAFRQRFGQKKKKPAHGIAGSAGAPASMAAGADILDVDDFLSNLSLDEPKTKGPYAGTKPVERPSQCVSSELSPSTDVRKPSNAGYRAPSSQKAIPSLGKAVDPDDDWLDEMLSTR